jgi:hypothetical protein
MVRRLAGLVVIDVLATAVALRSPEGRLDRVRGMKDALARMRSEGEPPAGRQGEWRGGTGRL